MARKIIWVPLDFVLEMHDEQIARYGGAAGIRDIGLIESAVDRPKTILGYEPNKPISELAAALGYALAQNHGFVDGNKRIAFQALLVFLKVNGLRLDVSESEATETILQLAAGKLSEADLADWLAANT